MTLPPLCTTSDEALGHLDLPALTAHADAVADGDLDGAWTAWQDALDTSTARDPLACAHRVALLQPLFPDGPDAPAALRSPADRLAAGHALAVATNLVAGRPGDAVRVFLATAGDAEAHGLGDDLGPLFGDASKSLRQSGRFREAEDLAVRALSLPHESVVRRAVTQYWYGMGLAHRGATDLAQVELDEALATFRAHLADDQAAVVHTFHAQRALWADDVDTARRESLTGWELAADAEQRGTVDLSASWKVQVSCARIHGESLVGTDPALAIDVLQGALAAALRFSFVEEVIPARRALALLLHEDEAERHLAAASVLCLLGPYPAYHADLRMALAHRLQARGDAEGARHQAMAAIHLAEGDGAPFTHASAIRAAERLIAALT